MRENFAESLRLVLQSEGGYVDHPKDPGGATNKGITLKTYQAYRPGVNKQDLRTISDGEVAEIYRRNYWNAVGADALPAGVDYCLFDYAVNSGPARAKTAAREADAAGIATAEEKIKKICSLRYGFLKTLPTFLTFGKGWTTRLHFVEENALRLAHNKVPPKPTEKPARQLMT